MDRIIDFIYPLYHHAFLRPFIQSARLDQSAFNSQFSFDRFRYRLFDLRRSRSFMVESNLFSYFPHRDAIFDFRRISLLQIYAKIHLANNIYERVK